MNYFIDWLFGGFNSPRDIIAQIIGFIPLLLSYFIFLKSDRRKIILYKACADLFSALHFFVLGAFSGGAINVVNVLRNIIFSQKDKKWASSNIIPVAFMVFTFVSAVLTFQGAKDVLPIIGSWLAIIGFWQNDIKLLRIFNLAGVALWMIYGIMTVSVSTIIYNVLSIISILLVLFKHEH